MIQVSVIIVNYNTAQYLPSCINSIIHNSQNILFEIFVVDNQSPNREIEQTLASYSKINFVQLPKNVGFGAACNVAAKQANGKYLFLLNPDTILHNNALKFFVDFWESQHSSLPISCIGALLQDNYGQSQHSFGQFPKIKKLLIDKLKSGLQRIFGKNNNVSKTQVKINEFLAVEYITGANLFVSKSQFDQYRGFDTRFFMYFEETDLQKRMAMDGLQSYLISGPKITHHQGASTKNNVSLQRVFYFDSLIYYIKKHENFAGYFAFKIAWYIFDFKTAMQKIVLIFNKNKH